TDLIRTFVAVCDSGSFRAGAERVHKTASAVSMQMSKLEAHVGAHLFEKEGRSVRLSASGGEFLGYARRILTLHDEAIARVNGPKLGGIIRFGAPDDYEVKMLSAILPRFARHCPDVEIQMEIANSPKLKEMVQKDELDLAFVDAGSLGERLPGDLISAEPLVWLGAQDGTAKSRRPLPVALPSGNCHWRHGALDALERAQVPYRIAFSCELSYGQLAAIQADIAVSALPASYLAPGLARVPCDEGLPDLGAVSVRLCEAPGANETARCLAAMIRERDRLAAA
ncbi:MAG: LysR substrate-binding domain-containing protein, partial [Pseudomonadota bacterium]